MTRAELPVLLAQVRAELTRIDRVVERLQHHRDLASKEGRSEERLATLSIYLHNFYNALEKVFERIARGVDEASPVGSSFHRDLLDQMSVEVPGLRSAVISDETRSRLAPFLDFRHRVRHLYFFDIQWDDVDPLAPEAPALWTRLRDELDRFLRTLETAGGAA